VFSLNQKTATRAAFSYVATQAAANVGGNATAQARIATLMSLLDDIVYGATNEGSICQTEIRGADYARLQLERNRDYIVAEITAYGAATYTTSVTASAAEVFTCADTSWMQRNAAIRFTGTVFGGVSTDTTYYVQNVVNSTTFKIATTRNSNTAITLSTVPAGTMTVSLYYPAGECERDVNAYIDALKFDLQYPGNYKSRFAARYYANAVNGVFPFVLDITPTSEFSVDPILIFIASTYSPSGSNRSSTILFILPAIKFLVILAILFNYLVHSS
jgi:hypothetical protein